MKIDFFTFLKNFKKRSSFKFIFQKFKFWKIGKN